MADAVIVPVGAEGGVQLISAVKVIAEPLLQRIVVLDAEAPDGIKYKTIDVPEATLTLPEKVSVEVPDADKVDPNDVNAPPLLLNLISKLLEPELTVVAQSKELNINV